MPIFVASALVPKNNGTFFVVEDTYLRGGFQVRPTLVSRDELDAINRKAGMVVYVEENQTLYTLGGDLQTWSVFKPEPAAHSHAAAGTSQAGYMSATDKTKLDGIAAGANNYAHPTGDGNLHVPATGTTNAGKVLTAGATAGSISWQTPAAAGVTSVSANAPIVSSGGTAPILSMPAASSSQNGYLSSSDWVTFNNKGNGSVTSVTGNGCISVANGSTTPSISIADATTSASGAMSAADKTKLNGIAAGATAYSHPSGDGNLHVPATGTTNNGKVLTAGATAGSVSWQTPAAAGVTSVGGTGSVNGLTLTGTVTSTGSITLGGSITSVATSGNFQMNSLGVGTPAAGTAGDIRATGDVTAYYSDGRLKDVVKTIDGALNRVRSLRGILYTNNALAHSFGYTSNELQVGLVAQEVQQILPEAVKPAPFDIAQDEDGSEYSKSGQNYLTVKYERLVPLLVEAIKEQQTQIEELKALLHTR